MNDELERDLKTALHLMYGYLQRHIDENSWDETFLMYIMDKYGWKPEDVECKNIIKYADIIYKIFGIDEL